MADRLKAVLLAATLAGAWFWFNEHILLNLADEGFLWYGAWRTAAGEVPIRDFHAYDPGRYYWIAAWSRVFGSGIVGVRAAASLFQVVGLALGILALRRVIRPWWGLILSGVLLIAWMYPRHKVFEHGMAMAAVFFGTLLFEKPTPRRHLAAGIFVGIAAFFGRNHGLYSFVALLALSFLSRKFGPRPGLSKRLLAYVGGIGIGCAPLIAMWALIPGFFDAFVESVLFFFRIRGTNLPLPVPWPWTVDPATADWTAAARSLSTGILYLIVPLSYAAGGLCMLASSGEGRRRGGFVAACVLVGAAYMHRSFSRAGLSFLAQGIHPFLMGTLALPFLAREKSLRALAFTFLGTVVLLTAVSVATVAPRWEMAAAPQGSFTRADVGGSILQIHTTTADLIRSVRAIYARVAPGERLLIAPHWPGLYPLLNQESPVWETFFLFPETEARQRSMIRDMEAGNVNWVILGDVPLDGREELRFRNTHAHMWRYITENFRAEEAEGLPPDYAVLRRRQ